MPLGFSHAAPLSRHDAEGIRLATDLSRWRLVWRYATSDGVPRRSFRVAAIVATLVSLINQWETLLQQHTFNPWKVLLTFMVSYFVSTYGAVSLRLHGVRAAKAVAGDKPAEC